MKKDIEHLNILSIFHFVMAGLNALFALFPLIYVILGIFILTAPQRGPGPPPAMGWFFIVFGATFSLVLVAMAGCSFVAGIALRRHKWRIFCFINAGLLMTQMPHGTVLGIFTILVLSRPTVQDLFAGRFPRYDPEDDRYYDPEDDRPERDEDEPSSRRLRDQEGYYDPREGGR